MFGEKGLGYSLAYNYIGSYESIIPKMVYFGLNSYLGGLKLGSSEFAIALSSLRTLIATIGDQKSERDQERGPGPKFGVGPFTLRGVTSLGPRIEEPLEGHIYFPSPGGPQFVNFNEDNVVSITEDLIVQAIQFLFDQEYHKSKLFHGSRYSYSVPDITGHITFFNIDEINLLRASGDAALIREDVVTRNRYNSRQEQYIMSGFKFSTNI
ncbi:vitellogenin-like, partial [Gryllus bimaculatus]